MEKEKYKSMGLNSFSWLKVQTTVYRSVFYTHELI